MPLFADWMIKMRKPRAILTRSWWKKYYWRVIGFAMAGAGVGLIADELTDGPFHLGLGDHELWGIVLFVVGLIFISLKPKGKD